MSLNPSIKTLLSRKLHVNQFTIRPVRGGSINNTFQILTHNQTFFCKFNNATKFPHLLELEAEGLRMLEKQGILITPEIIDQFEYDDQQYLILQWIRSGQQTQDFWKLFGKQLAQLHLVTDHSFGLETNNYMGAVPQNNSRTDQWPSFFIQQRLAPLVQQCEERGLLTAHYRNLFDNVYNNLPALFGPEKPALLHGDLLSGNFICNEHQQPVLIDPAVYFGHRSMDLGMTTLFGGFDPLFYEAYHYHYSLPDNHKEQWRICNLYPLLIHLLLFGESYLPSIYSTLEEFQ